MKYGFFSSRKRSRQTSLSGAVRQASSGDCTRMRLPSTTFRRLSHSGAAGHRGSLGRMREAGCIGEASTEPCVSRSRKMGSATAHWSRRRRFIATSPGEQGKLHTGCDRANPWPWLGRTLALTLDKTKIGVEIR